MATVTAPTFQPSNGNTASEKTPKSKFINSLQSPEHTPSTTASTPSSSPSSTEFYAIRKGRGVHNCIFTTWDHAKEHVHNYKEAVYNVFDKMEDALLYIRLPSKANGLNVTKPLVQNRKRTAVLPSSNACMTNKKPRTVSIVQPSKAPVRKVSLCLGPEDKENKPVVATPVNVQTTKVEVSNTAPAVEPVSGAIDEVAVEDTRPLTKILEEGYKNNYVKGWRANALFPQKKQCR